MVLMLAFLKVVGIVIPVFDDEYELLTTKFEDLCGDAIRAGSLINSFSFVWWPAFTFTRVVMCWVILHQTSHGSTCSIHHIIFKLNPLAGDIK